MTSTLAYGLASSVVQLEALTFDKDTGCVCPTFSAFRTEKFGTCIYHGKKINDSCDYRFFQKRTATRPFYHGWHRVWFIIWVLLWAVNWAPQWEQRHGVCKSRRQIFRAHSNCGCLTKIALKMQTGSSDWQRLWLKWILCKAVSEVWRMLMCIAAKKCLENI